MTDTISNVLLWNTDPVKVAMWATRERKVLEAVSLLMVCLHSSLLQGTSLTALRSAASFPSVYRKPIAEVFGRQCA
jgi:hypothetical protein